MNILKVLLAIAFPVMALTSGESPSPVENPAPAVEDTRLEPDSAAISWARSVLDTMSIESKIGQLLMVPAYSKGNEEEAATLEKLIRQYRLGGIIFMQGTPQEQVRLANRFQSASSLPLLVSQDAEWGLSMRLDNTVRFPRNMTLGAIRDSLLLFELGMEMGRQCRRVGVQVNFAPDVDVNNNPRNPVIGDRSFGENREVVANNAIYLFKGMENSGVITCAKHFPGHGDTDTDSHLDLPLIKHSRARLDSIELYPFRKLIRAGVPSVMVAHLQVPALDTTRNRASTLSPKIVTKLLRNELGFQGLIFTDALNMQGVAKYYPMGEANVMALLAGADVLLFPGDVPQAVNALKNAVKSGRVKEADIDVHVMRILVAKQWAGLNEKRTVPALTSLDELNTAAAKGLKKRLYEAAITSVKNDGKLLPLNNVTPGSISVIEIGADGSSPFLRTVQKYTTATYTALPKASDAATRAKAITTVGSASTVIVALDGMNRKASDNWGVTEGTLAMLKELETKGKQVVLVVFGNPYSLKNFGTQPAIVIAYENDPDAKIAAAEALFGGIPIKGRLPVTASLQFKEGIGDATPRANRINFGIPEEAGMDGNILRRIDTIAAQAIADQATPGCAVLVMHGNKIVWDKGYGKTEYEGGVPVDPEHVLYDLASVTKVTSTTLMVMKLWEEGKLNLDESISSYLGEFSAAGKSHVKVRNLLSHNSGFRPWIPFYTETYSETDSKKLNPAIYHPSDADSFCVPVARGLYMCSSYRDTMWARIVDDKLQADSRVRYSDLNMMVMQRIIEKISGVTLDRYVDSVFFQPLGMGNTTFNPAINRPQAICAPTELDLAWRGVKVQGYVHDQAAAMWGGVSGHAGLFSNIYDLSKLLYMLQNEGNYGGHQYFKPETVKFFTQQQMNTSRRGLGWDKPDFDDPGNSPASTFASKATFGHLGFTGICVWVDPEYEVTFVFLSNRTFPDANNKKLITSNVRGRIHNTVYESLFTYQMRQRPWRSS
jgi:beta-glucosidase-like glycosyl hydrolase/CubicO group peptidase (beta-lactamase class C family)